MESVWVVTRGEYSDYRVVSVFSTKGNAEVIADKVGGTVEEWPMDPWLDHINQGRRPYIIWMARNGDTERVSEYDWDAHQPFNTELLLHRSYRTGTTRLEGTVIATDEQHAIKIANEIRVQYIAEGRWPE